MNWLDGFLMIALIIPGLAVGFGVYVISKKSYFLGGMLIVSGLYSTIVFAGIKLIQLWGLLA